MLPEYFAVVGALVASAGGFVYLYETIKGRAKPNRVSWILWGVLPMITFAAQRAQGVTILSWVSFSVGLLSLLTVAASFFNRKAYWKTSAVDYACLVLALVGIALWAFTKDPNLAIVFSIAADIAAGYPTLRKAYLHPHTESWTSYAIYDAGFIISLLAVHAWTFANSAYVIYLVAMNTALTLAASRGRLLAGARA